MTGPTILVPLDGAEHSLDALPVAKHLADLKHATLHLVHVARESAPPAELLERIGLGGATLRGTVLHAKAGDPADGIVQLARELGAELVVMCTHTASPLDSPLGRTSLAVLQSAPCPLVLIHPRRGMAPWTLRRVLLPHDGTPTTTAAIPPSAELTRAAGAELIILHVASERSRLPTESGAMTVPRYLDQPQHEWPAWAAEFVERMTCAFPLESLRLRMVLATGSPADETLRYAAEHDIDMIVLAWRGQWQGPSAATVKTVLRDTSCPVMIVRASESRA